MVEIQFSITLCQWPSTRILLAKANTKNSLKTWCPQVLFPQVLFPQVLLTVATAGQYNMLFHVTN